MSLIDLCNDFWDEVVSLMEVQVLERVNLPKGKYSRMDALRRYFIIDPEFLEMLVIYLHLNPEEMVQEMALLETAS